MHLVDALVAGVNGAESGTAYFYSRGTSTPATYYTDFEATSAVTTGSLALDANGGGVAYVAQLCTVVVKSSSGTTVRTFVAGSSDDGIEVRSPSFTGVDYETAASAAGKPTTLAAVLDLWKTNAGNTSDSIDWKVTVNGTGKTIASWLSQTAGLFVNVKDPSYGAVGDGVADDTAAIQAALTAADLIGSVVFPAGTYKITGNLTGTTPMLSFAGATLEMSAGVTITLNDFVTGLRFSGFIVNGGEIVLESSSVSPCIATACYFVNQDVASAETSMLTIDSDALAVVTGCVFATSGPSQRPITCSSSGINMVHVEDCHIGSGAATYNPSAMVYSTAGDLSVNRCVFYATSTAGTVPYVKALDGDLRVTDCTFNNGSGATLTAITASTLSSGDLLYESGNFFGSSVTRYAYNSADRDNCAFSTRDQAGLGGVEVSVTGAGGSTISADQYGTMHFTAGAGSDAAQTLTLAEGCKHQRFRIAVTNNRGGALAVTFAGRVVANAADLTVDVASGLTSVFDFHALSDGTNYEWFLIQTEASGTEVAL